MASQRPTAPTGRTLYDGDWLMALETPQGHLALILATYGQNNADALNSEREPDENPGDDSRAWRDTWDEWLAEMCADSSLEPVTPAELGALTDAPILGYCVSRDLTGEYLGAARVWWWPQYEVYDMATQARRHGFVIFQNAEDEPTPELEIVV